MYVATAQKNHHEHRFPILTELWDNGIKAEQSYKKNPKLLPQLQHCEDNRIPLAIIIGEGELQRNEVILRNVETREEKLVPREKLIVELKEMLKNLEKPCI